MHTVNQLVWIYLSNLVTEPDGLFCHFCFFNQSERLGAQTFLLSFNIFINLRIQKQSISRTELALWIFWALSSQTRPQIYVASSQVWKSATNLQQVPLVNVNDDVFCLFIFWRT